MKAGTLTPATTRALSALASYHYLMPRQFTRLPGFPKKPEGVHKLLRRFPAEKGEVGFIRAGVDNESKAGRVPRLYYLTKHGAAAVDSASATRKRSFTRKGISSLCRTCSTAPCASTSGSS